MQHPALKYSNQLAPFPLRTWWLCDLQQRVLCLSYTLYQFPHCSCRWVCGWTLLVPLPCFSEMFELWVTAVVSKPTALRAAQNSSLLQLYSAPQWLPCCVGLCVLIFLVSAYRYWSKPCSLMLCFSARHCCCSICLACHLSLVMPFTSVTLILQLFLSISSHSIKSFWGVLGQVIIYTTRSFHMESLCFNTEPRHLLFSTLGQGSYSQWADTSDKAERWRGPVAFFRPSVKCRCLFVSAVAAIDLTETSLSGSCYGGHVRIFNQHFPLVSKCRWGIEWEGFPLGCTWLPSENLLYPPSSLLSTSLSLLTVNTPSC